MVVFCFSFSFLLLLTGFTVGARRSRGTRARAARGAILARAAILTKHHVISTKHDVTHSCDRVVDVALVALARPGEVVATYKYEIYKKKNTF